MQGVDDLGRVLAGEGREEEGDGVEERGGSVHGEKAGGMRGEGVYERREYLYVSKSYESGVRCSEGKGSEGGVEKRCPECVDGRKTRLTFGARVSNN